METNFLPISYFLKKVSIYYGLSKYLRLLFKALIKASLHLFG